MTFDEMVPELFRIVGGVGARPDVPIEAEDFFTEVVAGFNCREACRAYLEEEVPKWYRSLRDSPGWIQDPDWPWFEGKPMVFVGSLDAPHGTFHDDARFYVFWSPESGVTECVIQVS